MAYGSSGLFGGLGGGMTAAGAYSGNPALLAGGMGLQALGSFFGASDQADAERAAARARQQAIAQAGGYLQQGYDQQMDTLSPALQAYSGSMGNYANAVRSGKYDQAYGKTAQDFGYTNDVSQYLDPQAAYQQQQMQRALNEQAAASGGLYSGGFAKELQDRSNQLAQSGWQQAFGNMQSANQGALSQYSAGLQEFYNRMNNMAQRAQGLAQNEQGLLGTKMNLQNDLYGNRANLALQSGNVNADKILGVNNAWSGMGSSLGNILGSGITAGAQSGAFNGLFSGGTTQQPQSYGYDANLAQQMGYGNNPQQIDLNSYYPQTNYTGSGLFGNGPSGVNGSPQATGSGLFGNQRNFGFPVDEYLNAPLGY